MFFLTVLRFAGGKLLNKKLANYFPANWLQEIAGVKEDAQKDLDAAKPALEAAVAALNSITPKDIASLKGHIVRALELMIVDEPRSSVP